MDDLSWKSCPADYVPGMINEYGFEQTMDTMDFNPGNLLPSSSTPAFGQQTSENDLLRFHRQAQGEGVRERRPGMVYTGTGAEVLPSGDLPQFLPSDVEEQVRRLRAQNQAAQTVASVGGDVQLTIAEVRRMPGMQEVVGDQINVFKEIIPALASAPSASAPLVAGAAVSSSAPLGAGAAVSSLSSHSQQGQQIPDESQQGQLSQSEAEFAGLVAQQQQVYKSMEAAKAAQAYMLQQQQTSLQPNAPAPIPTENQ